RLELIMRFRFLVVLTAALFAAPVLAAPLTEMPEPTLKRIVGAAGEALQAGKLASKAVKPALAFDRAIGYRYGEAALLVVPDRVLLSGQASGQDPRPVAMVIPHRMTLGDYTAMVPPGRAAALAVPEGPQDLTVFFLALRRGEAGPYLDVYGLG